ARLPRHGRQRARRLEAVRPLRGVQVHRGGGAAGVHLHHAAAGAARRPAQRRPGPAEQGRPARRLRRGSEATAYLLMSALSAAIPITNRMREGSDNVFTDSSAASISMAFFAFVCLALSALISGFKLSKQTYI
uniref:CASP-like protein n=1 Tax=Aegilops tauschii subsp. strangulata TaxID=200361 RepID=A0A452YRS4_AEGTS